MTFRVGAGAVRPNVVISGISVLGGRVIGRKMTQAQDTG